MQVAKYGVHRDADDVAWLLQGTGFTSAIGMPSSLCDIHLLGGIGHCFHDINLAETTDNTEMLSELRQVELFKLFEPIPADKGHAAFLRVQSSDLHDAVIQLTQLQMLASPVRDMVVPIWMGQAAVTWARKRSNSNIGRLVIFGDFMDHHKEAERLCQLTIQLGCRVLFVGPEHPEPFGKQKYQELASGDLKTIEMQLLKTWSNDELRALGASILKEHMRQSHDG